MSVRQTGISDLAQLSLGEILIRADNPSAIAGTSKYFRETLYQTLFTKFVSQPSTQSFVPTEAGLTTEERVRYCVLNLKKFCGSFLLTPKNQLNPIILAGVVETCMSVNTIKEMVKTASSPKIKIQLLNKFMKELLNEHLVLRSVSKESIIRCEKLMQKKTDEIEGCVDTVIPQDFFYENGMELSEFVSSMKELTSVFILLSSMANNVDGTGCDDIEAVNMVLDSGPISIDSLCNVIIQAIEFKNEIILALLLPLLHDSIIPTYYLEKMIMAAAENEDSELTVYLMKRLPEISSDLYKSVERVMPTIRTKINPPSCIIC
jgi:hypothetical protein